MGLFDFYKMVTTVLKPIFKKEKFCIAKIFQWYCHKWLSKSSGKWKHKEQIHKNVKIYGHMPRNSRSHSHSQPSQNTHTHI